jgi:UbiD family decarboxylase
MMAGSHMYRAPYGTSELEIAGYLQGDSVPVVRGPITGLPIPATAEIAIEGFIPSPDERVELEGPFGEWTGYYAHGRRPETVIEVAAIYYRNDPIIYGSPPVRPIRTQRRPPDEESAAARRHQGREGRIRARAAELWCSGSAADVRGPRG